MGRLDELELREDFQTGKKISKEVDIIDDYDLIDDSEELETGEKIQKWVKREGSKILYGLPQNGELPRGAIEVVGKRGGRYYYFPRGGGGAPAEEQNIRQRPVLHGNVPQAQREARVQAPEPARRQISHDRIARERENLEGIKKDLKNEIVFDANRMAYHKQVLENGGHDTTALRGIDRVQNRLNDKLKRYEKAKKDLEEHKQNNPEQDIAAEDIQLPEFPNNLMLDANNPDILRNIQKEEQLKNSPIREQKAVAEGENRGKLKLVFGPQDFAIFKPKNGEKYLRSTVPVGSYYNNDLASYSLSKILGFSFCPPVVHKNIDGKIGSVQQWINDQPVGDKYGWHGAIGELSHDTLEDLAIFNMLISNSDRHNNNWMYSNGKPYTIDNGLTFPTTNRGHEVRSPFARKLEGQTMSPRIVRKVEHLKTNQKEVTQYLSKFLNREAVASFNERIDQILETKTYGLLPNQAWF